MAELKARIYKDDSPVYGGDPWHYTVDYVIPPGLDVDLSSFDYGNVGSQEFAMACVQDAFMRYADGECRPY